MADLNKTGDKLQQAGETMQAVGCLLTGLITLPLIGLVVAGIPGLIVGIVAGALLANGVRKKRG